MEKVNREGEFYLRLQKLLECYLYRTGIPYLKLEINVEECVLSESLKKVTVKVKKEANSLVSKISRLEDDYTFQVNLVLNYRDKKIGSISILIPKSDFPNSRLCEVFEPLPKQIIRLLARRKLAKFSQSIVGKPFSWLGESNGITRHEESLDQLAEIGSNLAIVGSCGSGKLLAALSTHIFGDRQELPFITTNCADWEHADLDQVLDKLFQDVKGGTIYFRYFDTLNNSFKERVLSFATTKESVHGNALATPPCRLIISVNSREKLHNTDSVRKAYPSFVTIEVPGLSERKSDIKEIGRTILEKFCQPGEKSITERGWLYLEQLNWKHGVEQLELVILNLLKQSNTSRLDYSLLKKLVPKIDGSLQAKISIEKKLTIIDLAIKIADEDFLELSGEHPAIQKAITYLASNYDRNFDLEFLARHSCVSSSHLSYLFRSRLNTSYKQLLTQCRIEKAKKMLIEFPTKQVTEISLTLGFCDLSHFEKAFRKRISMSPNHFRERQQSRAGRKLILLKR
jgi:AraC-like DNA-binding protein